MTTTARVSKLPKCDICEDEDLFSPPEEARYDGKTKTGIWGYMCERHFQTNGTGLGLGRGQRLITESEHTDEDLDRADRLCLKCGKGCSPKSMNKEEIRYRILDQPQRNTLSRATKIELMIELGLYCEEVVYF